LAAEGREDPPPPGGRHTTRREREVQLTEGKGGPASPLKINGWKRIITGQIRRKFLNLNVSGILEGFPYY